MTEKTKKVVSTGQWALDRGGDLVEDVWRRPDPHCPRLIVRTTQQPTIENIASLALLLTQKAPKETWMTWAIVRFSALSHASGRVPAVTDRTTWRVFDGRARPDKIDTLLASRLQESRDVMSRIKRTSADE